MRYKARNYQKFSSDLILKMPYLGLFLDMGLGKTVSSLTAVNDLIYDWLSISKVLVIAPKRVAWSVWPAEQKKWDHLHLLRMSTVVGTEKQRKAALQANADVYVINRENIPWLVAQYNGAWPFKMVIIDESSSFKSHDSARFKAMRLVRPFIDRLILLTGTPTGNGLMDLWAQIYLLDQGKRLGKFITDYRDRFFVKKYFKYVLREGAEEQIYNLISDICVSMKSEDYLDMPKCAIQDFRVKLSGKELAKYEEFERERVLDLGITDVNEITAVNAAVLTGKLLQFANGAIYDENKDWHEMHTAKIEALEEILESAGENPIMVAYSYKHDLERLKKHFKSINPRTLDTQPDEDDWNAGKIKMLLLHPQSAGHGLNLQFGGHIIVWFGNTWNLELYQQLNKRLDRPGQTHPVLIIRIIAEDTMDERVIPTIEGKAEDQDALMDAVKAVIKKHTEHGKIL